MTYTTLGAIEVFISAISVLAYVNGDSGLTDEFLVMAAGSMGAFILLRGYFLFVKPNYMDAQQNAKKSI